MFSIEAGIKMWDMFDRIMSNKCCDFLFIIALVISPKLAQYGLSSISAILLSTSCSPSGFHASSESCDCKQQGSSSAFFVMLSLIISRPSQLMPRPPRQIKWSPLSCLYHGCHMSICAYNFCILIDLLRKKTVLHIKRTFKFQVLCSNVYLADFKLHWISVTKSERTTCGMTWKMWIRSTKSPLVTGTGTWVPAEE